MTNLKRLNELIGASGYKLSHIASVLGISQNTLRLKLRGKSDFRLIEAAKLCTMLSLSAADRDDVLFGFREETQNVTTG